MKNFMSMLVMFAGSIIGGFICTSMMGASGVAKAEDKPGKKIIEAQEFRLVDEVGQIRAILTYDKDQYSVLALKDQNGIPKVSMRVLKDGPDLELYGEKSGRAWLSMRADTPSLNLKSESGYSYFSMAIDKNDPLLEMGKGSGNQVADQNGATVLGVTKDGAYLRLLGKGQPNAKTKVTGSFVAGIDKNGNGTAGVIGPDDEVLWQAK